MRKNKYIRNLYEVDSNMTFLFWEIYGGNEYQPIKENATLSDYKIHFSHLIKTLRKSFIETVLNTDSFHLKEIDNLIKDVLEKIKKVNEIEDLSNTLLVFFPKFCFLIIGRKINNIGQRLKDNRGNWNINQHRQIIYIQNKEQQGELLIKLIKENKIPELKNLVEAEKKYFETKKAKDTFMDWFKRNYPSRFFEIFDLVK